MTPPEQHLHCLPAGTQLKDYRIEHILGKGGFGITYLAEDIHLQKKVAIKELLPDGIATRGTGYGVVPQTQSLESDYRWAVAAFLKEAQILAGFDHPNIVHVYRLFEANDTAYMVMPFVSGASLKEKVKSGLTLPYEETRRILKSLMGGLEMVHQANTLHRDIKPDNIILNKNGTPILIDFGAARQQITGKTQDITSIITPGYAPVEQYSTDAKYQGPWSDIYALAACTFFMITGQKPTPASERSDALRNQQPDPMPKLAALSPQGYPTEFLQAIDCALQMSESQRPQSIPAWRSLLTPATTPPVTATSPNYPQSSPPPQPPNQPKSTNHQNRPTKKKNKLLIASICTLALTALVAIGLVIWENQPNDPPKPSGNATAELTKTEAYIDVDRPHKARAVLDGIDLTTLPPDQKNRYDELAKQIKTMIGEGQATLAINIEPISAKLTMDGKTCQPTHGKITVAGLGYHALKISAPGYQSQSIHFECKKIGEVIKLKKVILKPDSKSQMVATLISDLEQAIKDKNTAEVTRLFDELKKATVPSHLDKQAKATLDRARTFKSKNQWQITLITQPSHAEVFLNGAKVQRKQSKFRATQSGKHQLKITADGYEDQTRTFTLQSNGQGLDLGTISLNKKKAATPLADLSKEDAIQLAKAFITHGNSTHAHDAQMQFLHDQVFFGEDQKNSISKEKVKQQTTELFKQWKTRTFSFTQKPITATLSDSKKSWVVSAEYTFEWKDAIFTYQGKRTGLFAIMPINGKARIVAYKSNTIGEDTRNFESKPLIAALKIHNQNRLTAGDSDGGELAWGEASYYSDHTEYYGARMLTRNEIAAKIRASRAKSKFRAYQALTYSDFTIMDQEDKSRRTFSYKCVTEVIKDNGKTTRTERVKVRFDKGNPYVISVRY